MYNWHVIPLVSNAKRYSYNSADDWRRRRRAAIARSSNTGGVTGSWNHKMERQRWIAHRCRLPWRMYLPGGLPSGWRRPHLAEVGAQQVKVADVDHAVAGEIHPAIIRGVAAA